MLSVHKVYRYVGTEWFDSMEGSLLKAVFIIAILTQDWAAEHNPSLETIPSFCRLSLILARIPSDNIKITKAFSPPVTRAFLIRYTS